MSESNDIDELIASALPRPVDRRMRRAFHERCRWAEAALRIRADAEIAMRNANFSSGLPIEAIFREELGRILPRRYEVTHGYVSDQHGSTAGHCDVVVFNDTWFPAIKPRPTAEDREHVVPVEGTYGVLEVKQTLGLGELDAAMKKLIMCSRLHRPNVMINQITENRPLPGQSTVIANPLFTAVVGIQRDQKISLRDLVDRFVAINQRLNPQRRQMIHCLCVLGEGFYFWGKQSGTEAVIAKFMSPEDLTAPLILLGADPDASESPFAALVSRLYGHLTNSVLADPTDIPFDYGVGHNYQLPLGGAACIPAAIGGGLTFPGTAEPVS